MVESVKIKPSSAEVHSGVGENKSNNKNFDDFNRAWFYDGSLADIFCGDILACRHDDSGNFTDIKDEDIPVITKDVRPYLCTMLGNFIVPEHTIPEYKGERGIKNENE